jgi:hypothetical protein
VGTLSGSIIPAICEEQIDYRAKGAYDIINHLSLA